jgi:hypothetical protein
MRFVVWFTATNFGTVPTVMVVADVPKAVHAKQRAKASEFARKVVNSLMMFLL